MNKEITDSAKKEDIETLQNDFVLAYSMMKQEKQEKEIYRFILEQINLTCDFEYFESPKVSIIIPVKNEYLITQFLLNSIQAATKDIAYEVIIADDNSTDMTTQIPQLFTNVRVVKNNSENPGFLYNVSNAIKYAKGEFILLLNNDMMVLENYLIPLVEIMEKDNTIGIAGAKNLSIEGKIQECGVKMYPNGCVEFIGYEQPEDFADEYNYTDCDYCSGCSILFRREVWEKTGGFDKNLAPAYYEDSDFAFNLKYNYGLKSVCVPKSKIIHYKGASYSKNLKLSESASKNRKYFMEKWQKYLK